MKMESITNRNKLLMKYPASWHNDMWREAIPLGNGEIGGLVYGGVWKEIVMISHAKLWHGGLTPEMPDVSDILPIMRAHLANNDPVSAETLMANEMKERGYNPQNARPLPICDICVTTNTQKPFKKYLRELDMETGEATVSWNEDESRYKRSFFIARHNDFAFYKYTVDDKAAGVINADISLSLHDTETINDMALPQNLQNVAENNMIKFAATKDNGTDYGAVAYLETDGKITYCNESVNVKNAGYIHMYIKVFIEARREVEWNKIENELRNIPLDYEENLRVHAKIHSKLFNSVKFTISSSKEEALESSSEYDKSNEELLLDAYQGEASNVLVEKLWSFGRYLLISASKEKGYPCQLYGLWTGDYNPMWAINMFNENLQMIYWQSLSGNMPELLMAVFDYVESKMDDYRENARKLYNCRGINIPAVSTPESGLHKCILPHILHWTGSAGWLCQHYYDYYLFTGDEEFLKNRAMPFMYETALFYEDFLTIDEKGYFVSSPSNSPENTPSNLKKYMNDTIWCEVVVNATMDFAIVKELLNNLIEGARISGKYCEKINHWKDMLAHIPPYQINEDGAIKEWIHDFYLDNYEHRHQSHIYPVFPGTEITKDSAKDLYRAFVTAVKKRLVIGLKDQSGWSLAHMANNYARMSEGEFALECIDLLSRSNLLNNFFTIHNDWRRMGVAVCGDIRKAPVQLDAIMGITAAVQEMLLFSNNNKLYVLPALPKRWAEGEVKGLRARGGIIVDITWSLENNYVSVLLSAINEGRRIEIELPEGKSRFIDLHKGKTEEIRCCFFKK